MDAASEFGSPLSGIRRTNLPVEGQMKVSRLARGRNRERTA